MAVTVCLSPNGANVYRTEGVPAGVLVGTVDGVVALERTDGGDWVVTGRALEGLHVSSLMGVAAYGSTFAGIHGGGLHRSRDGGRTWAPAATGLTHEHVFSLACDERGGSAVLYAGTEPANVFRSRDDGDSWELLPAVRAVPGSDDWNFPAPPFVAHVKHVTADPRDPDVLYVCVEQGALLKSTDGGATFEELFYEDADCHLNKDTHRIVFHPADPDQLWLDGGDGIFRSADAGRTWTRVATPEMRIGYPDHLFVDPSDPETVFVSGGGTPPNIWRQTGDARSTIACSRDGGRTWAPLGGGLPDSLAGNIEAVTMATWPGATPVAPGGGAGAPTDAAMSRQAKSHQHSYGFLAGTTDGEVFMSAERGQDWSLIATGLPAVSKCVHARNLALGRQAVAAGSS